MAESAKDDKVKILLFKEKGHLVIQYSVTNPDRQSEQCRDIHVAALRERLGTDFTDNERTDRLKIKCRFDFEADPNGSSRIWSLKEGDATTVRRYFVELNVIRTEQEGSWEFRLEEEYDWALWKARITPPSQALYSEISTDWRAEKGNKRNIITEFFHKALSKLK